MGTRSMLVRFALLIPVTLLLIASSSLLGPPGQDHAGGLRGDVYWQFRAPRTALAACAGAGLALGGVIFQALFRNPLATPYTLGIASGASLGAAAAMLGGVTGYWLGVPRLALGAFGGATAAMSVVYLMARLRAGRDLTRLLLAGVCVAYMSAAGILLITYLAEQAVTNDIVIWMMGSLAILRPRAWLEIAIILVPVVAYALYSHRALDLLALGDELAATRGVAVGTTVWTCYILVGLLVAVIVSNCGPIGFVGLMIPHITRTLVGMRTLPLVLGSSFVGGAFLAVCDGFARALSVYEIPVGVLTNILGAAFFFYLLATRDVSYATPR
ncbi:MAG: iron ABC transporter permease [Planctomycetes bacterium]|nr:iron ABC transporter permease [Planctomycetota bacterium]